MLETQAVVRDFRVGHVTVEPEALAGCSACAPDGCATKRIANLFAPAQPRQFEIVSDEAFEIGERVEVGVAESTLLRASLSAYIMPLLFVFAGAGLGMLFASTATADLMAALGAILGLLFAGVLRLRQAGKPAVLMLRRAQRERLATHPLTDLRNAGDF